MANGSFSWINLTTALSQLAQRLNDPTFVCWSQQELTFIIQIALREFNCLTFQNKVDYTFTNNDPTKLWVNLGFQAGSPRLRSITDTYCYEVIEAMLFEPVTGGTWTGTNQFNIADISQALQTRRDEIIQVTNCGQALLPNIPLTPNTARTFLPDSVIDVARVRYIPTPSGYYPNTLYRDDTVAQEYYESPLYQQNAGTPQTFSLSSEPPLSWDVDIPPNQPGTYEAVINQTGAAFNPPADTLLGIPDDFCWVAIYGALADLLGRESESTDAERSAYCLKRYQDGLNLLLKTPWIMLGKVNGQAVTCDSIFATDRYMPEWDTTPSVFGPCIVTGGIDFIAAPILNSTGLTLLGNMPVPNAGGDFLQISRSDYDTILDLAQAWATFKLGSDRFRGGLELEKRAIQFASGENSRLRSLGSFSDILVQRGQDQERNQTRYNQKGDNS